MKKIIALLLALCLTISLCPAFAEENSGLRDARSYVNLMYKNKPASTPKDYTLIGSVPGLEGYTIQCYRLTGGADLSEGDTITVTGMIKNYKGTIEFDKGCTYVK